MEFNVVANKLRQDRGQWLKFAKEAYELFYKDVENTGTQFSKKNLEAISKSYNIPISINVIYPTLDQQVAFLAGGKPSVRIMPVGEADKNIAYQLQEIWSAIWYRSDSVQKNKYALLDCLNTGSGWMMPEPSTFYSRSPLGIVINHLPYDIVFPDRNARKWDYSDAEYIMLSKDMTEERIMKQYGLTKARLQKALGTGSMSNSGYNNGFRTASVNEIYLKEYIDSGYIGRDGQLSKKKRSEQDAFIEKDIVVRRVVTLNDTNNTIYDLWMPIHEYPMIHIPCIWNSNPINGRQTYGLTHQIADCQDGINKCIAHSILNAQLHGHVKLMAIKGTIEKEQFEKFGSSPIALLEVEPTNVTNAADEFPHVLNTPQLPNAHYELSGFLIKMVELITGMYSVMQGSPYEAPSTVGGTQSLQAYGSQRIKEKAGTNDTAYSKLCHVAISMAMFYNDPEKTYRYISDDSLDENGQQQKEQWREVKLGAKNLDISDYDVVAVPSPSTPTSRMMASTILTQIASQVGDPNIATEVLQQTLKLLDLPEADKMIKRLDTIKVLQQQLSSASEQINRMTQELDNTIKQNKALMVKMEVNEQINEVEKHAIKQMAEIDKHTELAKQEVGIETDRQMEELEPDENTGLQIK
jgi:hypothetical protein